MNSDCDKIIKPFSNVILGRVKDTCYYFYYCIVILLSVDNWCSHLIQWLQLDYTMAIRMEGDNTHMPISDVRSKYSGPLLK